MPIYLSFSYLNLLVFLQNVSPKEKLTEQAEKLLLRRNNAVAMKYFKAIGNGAKVAECLRNIKMLREAYEARKRQQAGK